MNINQMAGFRHEMEKISGEMQGHTRIGTKPIGVERMLEKEREAAEEGKTPSTIFDIPVETVAEKVASSTKALAALGLMGAGAVGYKAGENAVKDLKVGRQVRRAQRQGY
jgi:hypothetical protein